MRIGSVQSITLLATIFYREEMPDIRIYSVKKSEFIGTSICSRSRQYLGNWNYMPPYFPHMKHDMTCFHTLMFLKAYFRLHLLFVPSKYCALMMLKARSLF